MAATDLKNVGTGGAIWWKSKVFSGSQKEQLEVKLFGLISNRPVP